MDLAKKCLKNSRRYNNNNNDAYPGIGDGHESMFNTEAISNMISVLATTDTEKSEKNQEILDWIEYL